MDIKLSNLNNMNAILDEFEYLKKSYVEIILNLIDFSCNKKILPIKFNFMVSYIKEYISENKIELLENGIKYLLPNKYDILNFNINNLDEIENSINDISNIKMVDENYKINNKNDMLKLILEIKNNSKKLDRIDLDIIKRYVELLISILEQITDLYNL